MKPGHTTTNQSVPDIYRVDGTTTNEQLFVGREGKILEILGYLGDRSVSLIGPKGIGKSALLAQLRRQSSAVCLGISLQPLSHLESSEDFIQRFGKTMVAALTETGHDLPSELSGWDGEQQLFPSQQIPNIVSLFQVVCDCYGSEIPLLCLVDDFDQLHKLCYEEEILDILRTLIQELPRLRFVFSGTVYLYGEQCEYETPLHDVTMVVPLSFMSISSARKLLAMESKLVYKEGSEDLLMYFSGNIPFLLRAMCSAITEIITEEKREPELAEDLLFEALPRVLEGYWQTFFGSQWESLSGVEQLLLLTMQHISRTTGKPCSVAGLEDTIATHIGRTINLDRVFGVLKRRSFVKERYGCYELSSGLMEAWISDVEPKEILGKLVALMERPSELDRRFITGRLFYTEGTIESRRTVPYVRQTAQPRNPTILHISDIQYGKNHAFSPIPRDYHEQMLDMLLDDIEMRYPEEGIPCPNLVVVSGDIADWAEPEEYELATEFLQGLCSGLQRIGKVPIDERSVVVVPGNHDINWRLSEASLDKLSEDPDSSWKPNSLYPHRMGTFRHWFEQYYSGSRSYPLDPDHAFTIHDFSSQFGLLVVGLNSCHQEDHKHHWGHVSVQAIRNAEQEIEKLPNRDLVKLRIAVLHHNVSPVGGQDDFLHNREAVLERLARLHCLIVLHGHVHQTMQEQVSSGIGMGNEILTVGAGSLGVREYQRPGTEAGHFALSYNIVDLNLHSPSPYVRIHVREMAFRDGRPSGWQPWAGWRPPRQLFFQNSLQLLMK